MYDFCLSLVHVLSAAWEYKISLVPVLLTYFLFDLPAILRRLTGFAYVPIYFVVFPIGHSDSLYAEYLNEDDFYGVGASLTPSEKAALRRKIIAIAIFSMVFAAVLAPWLCGIIAAFYLHPNQFAEFLVFLFVMKIYLIVTSLWRLRRESRALMHASALMSVVAVYLMYLFFVWLGLMQSFEWVTAHLTIRGYSGLFIALRDYAYSGLVLSVGAVSAVTWACTVLFTKPSNITRDARYDESDATSELAASDWPS
jgi:hypothetical protein